MQNISNCTILQGTHVVPITQSTKPHLRNCLLSALGSVDSRAKDLIVVLVLCDEKNVFDGTFNSRILYSGKVASIPGRWTT